MPQDFTKAEKAVINKIVESTGDFMEKLGKYDFEEWEYEDAQSFIEFLLSQWFELAKAEAPTYSKLK